MIEEHTKPAVGATTKPCDTIGEIIYTVHGLDDDALGPEVVPPNLLHEFCVVDTLDPDAAGARGERAPPDFDVESRLLAD